MHCLAAVVSHELMLYSEDPQVGKPSPIINMHDIQCQLQADVVAPPNTPMCSANFYEHFIIIPTQGVKIFKMFTPASCGACWTCEG